ncbi:hypothetical protein BGZ83_000039 [Gryganskiella cystojenkinii]|nr:hypothetical protein BGZ83_000039 [Gryganskiella cystojenkinii]
MSRPEIILHHYIGSPYAEKITTALRVKGLPWCSVSTSNVLPRPLLEPLTHGYRRIPVMQIGNNVYCDTAMIMDELERRYPGEECSAQVGGLSDIITSWVDKQLFVNIKDQMPWGATAEEQKASPLHAAFGNANFLSDRSQLTGGRPINTEALKKAQPFLLDQLISNLDTLERTLKGGWILGTSKPSAADISVYGKAHWLIVTRRAPEYVTKENYPKIFAFFGQMNAYMKAHRHPTLDGFKISGEEALDVARTAAAQANKGFAATGESVHPKENRKVGQVVTVTPNDYGKVPVQGEIVEITSRRVSIRPEPVAGVEVVIHFPRNGYMIVPARKASL